MLCLFFTLSKIFFSWFYSCSAWRKLSTLILVTNWPRIFLLLVYHVRASRNSCAWKPKTASGHGSTQTAREESGVCAARGSLHHGSVYGSSRTSLAPCSWRKLPQTRARRRWRLGIYRWETHWGLVSWILYVWMDTYTYCSIQMCVTLVSI